MRANYNKINDYKIMMDFLIHWLDFLWIPFAFLVLKKHQKWKGVLFILACMLTLRLQVELMTEIGYENGILPFLESNVLYRGFVTYGVFIAGFLALGHVSKESNSFVYLAAGISVFTVAFVVSTLIMAL